MSPIEVWALACVALLVKILCVSVLQGVVRVRHHAYAKPEDAAFFGRGAEVLEADLPIVERAQGALRNDGENIPIFLALSLAYVLLECPPGRAPWLFGAFVLARAGHSVWMIWPTQPLRNLCYSSGVLVMAALAGHVVWKIFGA